MRTFGGLLALALVVGCANGQRNLSPLTNCSEPRPQVCTMEYDPVCAQMIDGSSKEYSSGCNACADDTVVGYRAGSCLPGD